MILFNIDTNPFNANSRPLDLPMDNTNTDSPAALQIDESVIDKSVNPNEDKKKETVQFEFVHIDRQICKKY